MFRTTVALGAILGLAAPALAHAAAADLATSRPGATAIHKKKGDKKDEKKPEEKKDEHPEDMKPPAG